MGGATTGPCIGHVEIEAYGEGAIGAIRDSDTLQIDIPNRTLNVALGDLEIKDRLKTVFKPERKLTPFLKVYRERFKGLNFYGKRKEIS